MRVEMTRGADRFIVSSNGRFYLVDLYENHAIEAADPGVFLKAGMWFDAGKVPPDKLAEIKEAMTHVVPFRG